MGRPTEHIDIDRAPRLPSRLFLYGLHYEEPERRWRSTAAVGLLHPAAFEIAHVYPLDMFDRWTRVYRAHRDGIRWLLFLTSYGQAATGTIDADFNFVPGKSYPAGTHPGWWLRPDSVAVDGNGELLLTESRRSGPTRTGFGQVDPDGTFIVWWQSEVALAAPERLLGLPHAHAWLTTTGGNQPTSTVSLLRRGWIVGSRTWNEGWTGMAAHGDLLVVYRAGYYEVCRVSADHQITTLGNVGDFALPQTVYGSSDGYDFDTPTGIFFYKFNIGQQSAEVRSLTERGFHKTIRPFEVHQLIPGIPLPYTRGVQAWTNVAPC